MADALSRLPSPTLGDNTGHTEDPTIYAISSPQPTWLHDLAMAKQNQHDFAQWANKVHTHKDWSIHNNLLLYQNCIFVHPLSAFIPQILSEYHSSPLGGHSGFDNTNRRICSDFFCPEMKSTILTFVSECDTCQRNKVDTKPQPGLLQPLHIPQGKWQDISMDFIMGLPPSARSDSILVVIDRLTKYAHFLPVHTTYKPHTSLTSTSRQYFVCTIFHPPLYAIAILNLLAPLGKSYSAHRYIIQHEFRIPSIDRWPI